MKSELARVYQWLPPWGKNIAATVWGRRLRSLRYGRETELLVEQALERDYWTAHEWTDWRQERLGFVLRRAAERVPYYRELWARRRREGDRSSAQYLENWPLLSKEEVRANPGAFVADDRDSRRMYHEHTSGSTGTPLDLWLSRATVRSWYALVEARCRRWHGLSRADRWGVLGGQVVVPAARRKPPYWVWNGAMNQLYLSSYHLSPAAVASYVSAMRDYGVDYLYGYTSSLYEIAQEIELSGGPELELRLVLTNAEPLGDDQRETMRAAFHCPVRETYGMSEIVAGASECPSGRMHLWAEVGLVEVLDGAEPARAGETGELVCTGLLNADMPLVRYQVGDRGRMGAPGEGCSCGRLLPIVGSIEGRVDDVLYSAEGRAIGRLDPVFKRAVPIREAQIVQESLRRITVRYVPADGFGAESARSIRERLRERMGDVEVVLERVDRIPRGANGKFRAVVCKLPTRPDRAPVPVE